VPASDGAFDTICATVKAGCAGGPAAGAA
jgi:hypothetical protein